MKGLSSHIPYLQVNLGNKAIIGQTLGTAATSLSGQEIVFDLFPL